MAGITWINQKILQSFRILKEVDLVLSAYLCIINLAENIAFFALSGAMYIFHAVYLQNYVIRKEVTYSSSIHHYILFRCFVLLNYTANIILISFHNLPAFTFFYSLSACIMFVWYAKVGHIIFYH